MRNIKVGDPLKCVSEIGPIATERLMARLETQVRHSVAAGCVLLSGGKRLERRGNYFSPTVLTNIVRHSPAYTEELYGPVAALFRVNNIDEAIELANDSPMALGACAWTHDVHEQQRFIGNIKAGVVFVNKRVRSDPRLPFGGMKQSGFGRELGVEGIRQFTASKSVWIENSTKREVDQ
jgi:succinate-semialdehyde dehydrogenase/glutarate-semialdehyde dehydrogenase